MDKGVSYPVHKGYLVKSPPDTRVTRRMKSWRKRWFILRKDKSLEYYEDKGGEKKFIKKIDLNLCTYLDTNLSHKRFEHIFSITIKGKNSDGRLVDRIYFLVADTSYEMKLWIDEICKLCDFQISDGHANGSDEGNHETGPMTKYSAGIDNEHCPLGNADKMQIRNARDSGIQITPTENHNNNSDLVAVSPPPTSVEYDYVPPPRHANPRLCDNEGEESGDDSDTYDVPPPHSSASNYNVVPASRRLTERRSCPLDISSSSESSLSSSQRRSSNECDDYDCPSRDHVRPPVYTNVSQAPNSEMDQPDYDVPPCPHSTYDVVPPRVGGEYSNLPCTIPLGMAEIDYHNVPKFPSKHYQSPNPSNSNYDTVPPPHGGTLPNNLQMYDTVPPPHGGTLPSNGNLATYDSVPPPRGAFSSNSDLPMYDSVPPHRTLPINSGLSTYDTVPQHRAFDTYDSVPPPVPYSKGSTEIYDVVPSHLDTTDNNAEDDTPAPPIPRAPKPTAYVNLTLPIDDSYNKPLPIPPDISSKLERDSGSYCGLEDVYDVPPQKHGVQVPSVDRSSKPVIPPTVNRFSKPESIKSRDYVNLPSRSCTFRDVGRQPKGVNLNRSKSAAGDAEPDAYLYMESPKRTHSSLRFSRKDSFFDRAVEEEESGDNLSYEYMEPQARHGSDPYQNFDPPDLKQPNQKSDAAPEKKLKGHYQDIDIVCQRDASRPSVPERRPNTNYTTIDLEKTKGFRKTCAGTANQVGRDASRQ